mgnify:CR=1 FL=1
MVNQTSQPQTGVSSYAKAASARLLSVQAIYEKAQNEKSTKDLYDQYIEHYEGFCMDGEQIVAPDGALFKRILYGVDERYMELEGVIKAHLTKDGKERIVEPLLFSILICAAYELLAHENIDAPIIINDYLNVAHAFYDSAEVGLVNAVLDKVSKVFR